MPNKRTYRPTVLRPEGGHTLKTLSIQRGIQRESNKILNCRNKKKKKKKHKEADNSNDPIIDEEPIVDPNSISTSDAETEDGVEPDKDNEKNDPPEVQEKE